MMPGTQLHTREPAAKPRGAAPVNDRRPADGQRAACRLRRTTPTSVDARTHFDRFQVPGIAVREP